MHYHVHNRLSANSGLIQMNLFDSVKQSFYNILILSSHLHKGTEEEEDIANMEEKKEMINNK